MSPERPGHPPGMRRAAVVAVLATCVVSLTGCVVTIDGLPSALEPPVSDVGDGEVRIVGSDDGPIDELARNALADLERFWSEQLPEVYGRRFEPLQGGYFSVDPGNVDRSVYPDGVSCGASPLEVQGNAFYCQAAGETNSDSISYDRAFLGELAEDFGDFIPDLVMAHEFGHAIQGRVGLPAASIIAETQADCFAGAWTGWVADGQAQHTTIRGPQLDEVLRGYVQLRDPVGTDINEQSAHGSYFDRVSAFQEGFSDGVAACRDNFDRNRVFTQRGFTDADFANEGNVKYPVALDIVDVSLPAFWGAVFDGLGERFQEPEVEAFDGSAPGCAPEDRDLVYCADEDLVAFDEADLVAGDVYEIGDFAVATAVAIPYALAGRDQLGLSVDDEEAVRSAVCLTGSYGAAFVAEGFGDYSISAGDLDESVIFLLSYGTDPAVIADAQLTGFELVDVFRTGFFEGVGACDL